MTDYIIGGEILKKRKLITIDGSKVTTETGIPLALNIVLPGVQSGGSDVRLAELDGTPIAREIECVDVPSTGAVMLHYPFDTTAGVNSQFYVYWGNASLNEPATGSTYGEEAVWGSSYKAVWHMNTDPSVKFLDSTSNNNDGTPTSMVTEDLVDGTYGKEYDFGTTTKYIDVSDSTSLDLTTTGEMTFLFNPSDDTAEMLLDKVAYSAPNANGYWARIVPIDALNFGALDGGPTPWDQLSSDASEVVESADNIMTIKWDTTGFYIYSDGVLVKSNTGFQSGAVANTRDLRIGERQDSNFFGASPFNGKISEIRISISHSANYIAIIHKNLNNPTASGTDPFYLNRYDDSQIYRVKSNSSGTKSTFLRRTPITRNHTGALTNYQQKYTVPYHVLMNSDFSDLRFNTQADGNGAYLDYWIESQADGVTADIWVESDYASGDDIIYMFYGNSSLTSEGSGADTFNFFEDFSGDLSKWTNVLGTWGIAGGMLHATSTGIPDRIKAPVNMTEFVFEGEFQFTALEGVCTPEMVYDDRADSIGIYIAGGTTSYNLEVDQVGGPNSTWDNDTNLHTFKITRDSSSLIKFYYDGNLKGSKTDSATTSFNNIMIESHGKTTSYTDNLKVRGYT